LAKIARKRKKLCGRCEPIIRDEQKRALHDRRVVETYGLRPGEYAMLYAAQSGKCPICQRATGRTKKLSVDHDHKIEDARASVRGLVCSTCNRMLGHSRDDPEFFERAAKYLRHPPARKVLT
jgi:hypothetical protein